MSTALFNELSSYFNMDDPSFEKELIRPAEIKEDVKLMEQRQRVTKIMKSKLFKRELENIVKLNGMDESFDGAPTSTLSLAEISEQLLLSAIPKNKVNNFSQLNNRKGIICINDLHKEAASMYGRLVCEYRCKLAAVFRLIDMYGWNNGFDMSMTTRPFKDQESFLINPFGLLFHEISASTFLSVDFKGNILNSGSTVLEAHNSAWMIHAALYSFRLDIRTILQLKTPAAITVSSVNYGLLPICREAIILGDVIKLDNLPTLVDEESKSTSLVLADIKNYLTTVLDLTTKILLIPNQGFLICGESIEEAWHYFSNCQIACETQLKLGKLDLDDIIIPPKETQSSIFYEWHSSEVGQIIESSVDKSKDESGSNYKWRLGELEFEALMRHLDNNGYRTGYVYRNDNIYNDSNGHSKENITKLNNRGSVLIPASGSKRDYQDDEDAFSTDQEEIFRSALSESSKRSEKWFHTPNTYKQITLPVSVPAQDRTGDASHLNSGIPSDPNNTIAASAATTTRWVSSKKADTYTKPQHPVTAGACVPFDEETMMKKYMEKVNLDSNSDVTNKTRSLHTSPRHAAMISTKEIIENQRRLKNKYYKDTNTAGPISCLLDSGLSREEALRLKTESMRKQIGLKPASGGDVVTSASKGIIQRGHQALVYQDLYKPANPFDKVTNEDLENYKREVDRKLNPYKYASVDDNLHHHHSDDMMGARCVDGTVTDGDIIGGSGAGTGVNGLLSEPEMHTGDALKPGMTSDSDALTTKLFIERPTTSPNQHQDEFQSFFQKTDYDEDYDNIKDYPNSIKKEEKYNIDPIKRLINDKLCKKLNKSESVDKTETFSRFAKFKNLRTFSFKVLGRSNSVKDSSTDMLDGKKSSKLAAPSHTGGAMTSETSGADMSHDDLDTEGKPKKRKHKFKFPFGRKKKSSKPKPQ